MRYQGRIANWNDDKGLGFITQNGGGKQVFAHIKAFPNRQRWPLENELVTCALAVDAMGHAHATSIAFAGGPSWP